MHKSGQHCVALALTLPLANCILYTLYYSSYLISLQCYLRSRSSVSATSLDIRIVNHRQPSIYTDTRTMTCLFLSVHIPLLLLLPPLLLLLLLLPPLLLLLLLLYTHRIIMSVFVFVLYMLTISGLYSAHYSANAHSSELWQPELLSCKQLVFALNFNKLHFTVTAPHQ
jgi:hypothetical protein